jgi:hypothetical protein
MNAFAFFILLFVGGIIINAIGFKESCRFFNKNVSFLEALIILIGAMVSAIIYEIIVVIIGFVVITYFSAEWLMPLWRLSITLAGLYGYFKELKNALKVGWITAILINILGNLISMLIIVGIVVILYIIGWWFGGMEHTAGDIVASQIPSNNIENI